jgi:hypothetical protein
MYRRALLLGVFFICSAQAVTVRFVGTAHNGESQAFVFETPFDQLTPGSRIYYDDLEYCSPCNSYSTGAVAVWFGVWTWNAGHHYDFFLFFSQSGEYPYVFPGDTSGQGLRAGVHSTIFGPNYGTLAITSSAVSEPAAMSLLPAGLAVLTAARARRRILRRNV